MPQIQSRLKNLVVAIIILACLMAPSIVTDVRGQIRSTGSGAVGVPSSPSASGALLGEDSGSMLLERLLYGEEAVTEPSPPPYSESLAEILYGLERESDIAPEPNGSPYPGGDGEFLLSLLDGPVEGGVVVEDLSAREYALYPDTELSTGSGSVHPPSDYEIDRIMPSATPLPPGYEEPDESFADNSIPEPDVPDDPVPEPTPAIAVTPPSPTPDPDPTLSGRLLAFDQAILSGPLPPECPSQLRVDGFGDSGSGTLLFPLDPDGSTKELILGMLPSGIDVHFEENGDRLIRVGDSEPSVRIEAFRAFDDAQRGSLSVPILFTRSWGTPFATVCSVSLENFFSPTEVPPPMPELSF